jgi:phosphohistidine phosphatase
MKKLILVRHAKSGYNISPGKTDLERTLNETGKHEAGLMAKKLANKIVKVSAIVSSPATRTLQTSEILGALLLPSDTEPQVNPLLYHPSTESILKVIERLPPKVETALLVSHNPGISDFINETGVATIDYMPTCGVLAIEVDAVSWADFNTAPKKFLFFEKPDW